MATVILDVEILTMVVNEGVADDDALECWWQIMRYHNWSPVGEPSLGADALGTPVVRGHFVKQPGLTLSPNDVAIVDE